MTRQPPDKRPWTVLIVDDQADVRRVLQRTLERNIPSIQIIEAENGKEGLERLAHAAIDLIISDQRMPQMEGIEFLTFAAKVAPDVPRVLLTGFADVDIAVRSVNNGHVSAFFQKPPNMDDLVAEVLRLLHKRDAEINAHQAFAKTIDLARKSVPFFGPLREDP